MRVPSGVTLVIEPGTVVKANVFAGINLVVEGRLIADGSTAQPIVFTSHRDDTAGGDTNNDGTNTLPAHGNWGSVQLSASSSGNVLDNVEMRYGGAGDLAQLVTSALVNNGSNALLLDGGSLVGNGFWDDRDIVYRTSGDVTVPTGSTLTIGAGQVVKFREFADDDLLVNGTIIADGTAAQPIILTSNRDDAAGGDTNNDGTGSAPGNGQWAALQLQAGSSGNLLDYVEIRYGGANRPAALTVSGANLAVKDSVIRQSTSAGIYVTAAADVRVENSLIIKNISAGVRVDNGGQLSAVNNTIDGNAQGLSVDGAATRVDLTNHLITHHTVSGLTRSSGAVITIRSSEVR